MIDEGAIWPVRTFVYAWFAEHALPPSQEEIAGHFNIPVAAGKALALLHEKHALFLEPGTRNVRLANPFSAIPTPFTVETRHRRYWANCAWDSFGIVAALQESDASIHSICTYSGDPLDLSVSNGQVRNTAAVVHFLVPFRHWYDDLVFT
jgi:hypothetical protein